MSVGTPYIFANKDYYYQYADYAGIYFNNDGEFMAEINKILENQILILGKMLASGYLSVRF